MRLTNPNNIPLAGMIIAAIESKTAMCNGVEGWPEFNKYGLRCRYEIWQYNNRIYAVIILQDKDAMDELEIRDIEEIEPDEQCDYIKDVEYA